MQSRRTMFSCVALLFALSLCAISASDIPATPPGWPSFRGWYAGGIAEGYRTPARWNVEKAQNVEWKIPIPGMPGSCRAVPAFHVGYGGREVNSPARYSSIFPGVGRDS